MRVNPYVPALPATKHVGHSNSKDIPSFGEFLKGALERVNDYQVKADEAAQRLVLGDIENLHEVLIATEQAKLSLQLAVQVTNKVIEAYHEIARMQI